MSVYDDIKEEIETMRIDKGNGRGTKLYKPLLILSMLDYHEDQGDETKSFNNPTHIDHLVDFFTIYLENEIIRNETYRNTANKMEPKVIKRTIREQPLFFITTMGTQKSRFFFNDLDPSITKANRPRRLDNMAQYFEIRVPEGTDLAKICNDIRSACIARIFKETGIVIGDSIVSVFKYEKTENNYYRLGQEQYRRKLKEKYNNKCAFCNFGVEHVLIASHAKPWVKCDNVDEKLSEDNGFLLCANHDKMFDRGYLTVNAYNNSFVFSEELSDNERKECIKSLPSDKLNHTISNEMKQYLKYHGERIFR